MADHHSFTSPRTTQPDLPSLLAALRAQDPTAGIQHEPGAPTYVIKKNTPWTAPQIAFAQNAIDAAPASSPQLTAQAQIDAWPIAQKALVLALIDQLNVLGARVTPPIAAITPAQAIAAIRDKAATLT